jgi:hypothetical protein
VSSTIPCFLQNLSSAALGGDFWQGVATSATVTLTNHFTHECCGEGTDPEDEIVTTVRAIENVERQLGSWYRNTKFGKWMKHLEKEGYDKEIGRVGAKLNPAAGAVEAGTILKTGEDFKGVQQEGAWNRVYKPILDIVTLYGASGYLGLAFDAFTWGYSVPVGVQSEIEDGVSK